MNEFDWVMCAAFQYYQKCVIFTLLYSPPMAGGLNNRRSLVARQAVPASSSNQHFSTPFAVMKKHVEEPRVLSQEG